MILPETPTEATDIYLTSPDPNNKENADTNQWNMDGKCSNFGLGLRRSGPEKPQTSEQDDPGRGCSTPTGDPRPGNKYINEQADGASNMLLGIIRELVDETRQWDASLFMNENFKSMLFKYDDSNLGGPKFTNSTEPENDNGLVGVNEGPVTKQLDMISFWEEGDWRHANDHPYARSRLIFCRRVLTRCLTQGERWVSLLTNQPMPLVPPPEFTLFACTSEHMLDYKHL
jgi:hypothetical protein